jgi:cytochrome c oxidase subunit 2
MLTLLSQSAYLPSKASTVSAEVDTLFNALLVLTAFFCLLIFAGMAVFAWKYRHRPGRDEPGRAPVHSTALELTWTIVPTIIVLTIFYYGFKGYLNMAVVPPNAYEITVDGYTWGWSFVYPNGISSTELHVPKDRPVRLILTSRDVIHSFYVPAFRIQKMNVPGRYNRAWFQATEVGEYDIFCAQYCGTSHGEMVSKVVVHTPEDFARWLDEASNPEKQAGFTPVKAGQQIISRCTQCHSIDGAGGTGPTFKDMFGKQEQLIDGSNVTVDENYVRDSILYPDKHVVQGFSSGGRSAMPSFLGQLRDKEIDWVIAYLKTISANYKGGDPNAGAATAPAAATQPAQ